MAIKVGAPGTKTVHFEAGTWYEEKTGQIHLTIRGHDTFHTTVSNSPTSERYHPNLFKKLKGVLEDAGRWPTREEQRQRDEPKAETA